jgi:hypothetical protein
MSTDNHSLDDYTPDDIDAHDTVTFDLDTDSSSIDRARNADVNLASTGDTYRVQLADGDSTHDILLKKRRDGWHADCWTLNDPGDRTGRCRGWVHHDGPCAHLWAVRSQLAHERLSDDDRRHDLDIEQAVADGGQEGRRR